MTIDFYMLCGRPLASVDEWQGALNELGFDLTLPPILNIATAHGAMTTMWRGEPAIFEFTAVPFSDLEETFLDFNFGRRWPNAYAMYTGSLRGVVAALISAAAISHCTDGLVFDPQAGVILKSNDAVRHAQKTIDEAIAFMRSGRH